MISNPEGLYIYDVAPEVEAFSTENGATLPYYVIQPHQTHTANVAIITDPSTSRDNLQDIDALITNLPNCAIGVRTADCVPVLLYDPKQKAIAAIHSGWRGTVKKISQNTIRLMQQTYGTHPSDLKAIIGPSISPASYEVGPEVIEAFLQAGFPKEISVSPTTSAPTPALALALAPSLEERAGGEASHLDLWFANRWLLEETGVKPENIHIAGICTYINHDRFYSARHDGNNHDRRIINAIKIH